MIATDPAIFNHITAKYGEEFAGQVEFAAAVSGILLTITIGGLWRQFYLNKAHAASVRGRAEHA